MLTVPYKRQYNRPFHTAEGDVCVSWRSLFLTVLHFRVCLEDLKSHIPHPPPKTEQKQKEKKRKKQKGKKHPHGALYANYVQCLFILKLVGK